MHSARVLLIGILVAAIATAIAAPDPLLLFATFAVLAIGVYLLWPARDGPVMLLVFSQQWLSVAMKPIQTSLLHRPLDELADFGGVLTPAAYFGLFGLTALALGMRVGMGGRRVDWSQTLSRDADKWPERQLIPFALIALVGGHILTSIAFSTGPARQVVGALGGMRQAGLFVLAFWCVQHNRALGVLAITVAIEVALGLSGFFADFRSTLLVVLIAIVTARPKVDMGSVAGVIVACAAILSISIFWSAIKPDYREFLSENKGGQTVNKPIGERAKYIIDAAQAFDGAAFQKGVNALVARTSYIDFLAKTIEYVPAYKSHQDGRQLMAALVHISTPRILFPNKPVTPLDTTVTAEFTGMRMTTDVDASISIGYLGELYIDFGYIGAIFFAFLFGVMSGGFLLILRQNFSISPIVSYGLAVTALLPFVWFETALIKYLGGGVTAFAGALFLQRFVIPRLVPAARRKMLAARPA